MLWYFSMYQRFSLLYFGIDTARTPPPSAFQMHGRPLAPQKIAQPDDSVRRASLHLRQHAVELRDVPGSAVIGGDRKDAEHRRLSRYA